MTSLNIQALHAVAGPGGVEGAGAGLGSGTSWLIGAVVLLFLLAVGWWSTTSRRNR